MYCFKKFCLKALNSQTNKICYYYIKMENIITNYIKNKHNKMLLDDTFTTKIIDVHNYTYNMTLLQLQI